MKHEAIPEHASFGVKLPKSIYSDSVISVSATPHDLICFYDLVILTLYVIIVIIFKSVHRIRWGVNGFFKC